MDDLILATRRSNVVSRRGVVIGIAIANFLVVGATLRKIHLNHCLWNSSDRLCADCFMFALF
ncbi:hypothetical protein Cal7507_5934 [Calothrix sp. PCC 7507]|nr:hypothetical protein Cal7507_5934 [Calothrix sp. PCC 7507]